MTAVVPRRTVSIGAKIIELRPAGRGDRQQCWGRSGDSSCRVSGARQSWGEPQGLVGPGAIATTKHRIKRTLPTCVDVSLPWAVPGRFSKPTLASRGGREQPTPRRGLLGGASRRSNAGSQPGRDKAGETEGWQERVGAESLRATRPLIPTSNTKGRVQWQDQI